MFPSRWEVFGIVCLEAISCGCPVLVSKATGLEEVLGPSLSNYTFDVNKGEVALEQKLISILDNTTQIKKLKSEIHKRAKELINMGEYYLLDLVEKDFSGEPKSDRPKLVPFYGKVFQLLSALNDVMFDIGAQNKI